MSVLTNPEDLHKRLLEIVAGEPCTLFAGAGTSAFAGLRTWHAYLLALADVLERYEKDLASVMRKRIGRDLLRQAAHSYLESTDMPVGEKYKNLVEQLKTANYDFVKLVPLVSLPFEAIVTTNYDRALLDAWARQYRTAPLCVERHDPTLKAAPFKTDFFIARIHGRIEVPEEIVLQSKDYEDLERDAVYQDFLHTLFLRRKCLFLGFSFLDPAIGSVLEQIKERGVFPKQHDALVPAGAKHLIAQLAEANIRVLLYDDQNAHQILWRAIEMASGAELAPQRGPGGARLSAFETARRLLAVCYARARMGKDVLALRSLVVQGIVISLVSSGERTLAALRGRLREFLAVNDAEADLLIEDAVTDLQGKQICSREADRLKLAITIPEAGEMQPVKLLAKSVIDRLVVRERYEPKVDVVSKFSAIIEEVIVLRGWDLGAEFAGAHTEEELNPLPTIQKAIDRHLPEIAHDRKIQIAESLLDVMRHPSPKEENALGEMGRLAFGIEIILQAGRSTMYATSFPETVYLDASVLLPAITTGHPYREAYWKAIQTVQEKVGTTSEIYVADVFLEEIYLHRNNASKLVSELHLDDKERLKAFISYFSPTNTNVYIGAYSTHIANETHPKPFSEFLDFTAPYTDEKSLVEFLQQTGIRTALTKGKPESEAKRYAEIREALLDAYEVIESDVDPPRRKRAVLKQHEAAQLALLEHSIEVGRRAVFVTADNKLRRAVRASRRLRPLLDSKILPYLTLPYHTEDFQGGNFSRKPSHATLVQLASCPQRGYRGK